MHPPSMEGIISILDQTRREINNKSIKWESLWRIILKSLLKKSIERAFDKAIENNKNLEMDLCNILQKKMDLCNIMSHLCTILQKNGFMQHYETMMIMS